jgi:hypothetical protein
MIYHPCRMTRTILPVSELRHHGPVFEPLIMLIPSLETSQSFDWTRHLNLNVASRPSTAAPQPLNARHRPRPCGESERRGLRPASAVVFKSPCPNRPRPERVQGSLDFRRTPSLLPSFFGQKPRHMESRLGTLHGLNRLPICMSFGRRSGTGGCTSPASARGGRPVGKKRV